MLDAAFQLSIVYFIISYLDPYILSWQTINRPIVVAPIVGFILGDAQTGIVMGAALESIFMGISAIGGQIPADATTATIVSVAYTILTGGSIEEGVALSLPIGTIMASFNAMLTPIWASFAPYWEKISDQPKKFLIQNLLFSAVMVLVPTIVMFFAVGYGVEGLNNLLEMFPAWFLTGLNAASGMLIAVGFSILVSMIWNREVGYFFLLGFVLVKYLALDTLPIAVIGAIIAATMFLYDKKIIELKNNNSESSAGAQLVDEEDFF